MRPLSPTRLETRCRRPPLRDGIVPRPRLTRPLLGSADLPLALLVAPAGYGKTTVLSQWAEQDRRPFAWVTLDEGDNDPRRLLASIASVLDAIEPLGKRGRCRARGPSSCAPSTARSRSFVLVLDDVHVLRAAKSLELLTAIVDHMPRGSQVALASRDEPRMPVGRLRANRGVVELRFGDLAMTPSEAAALLEHGRVWTSTPMKSRRSCSGRRDGRPASTSRRCRCARAPAPATAVAWFGGHDRLVADYVRDEMLSGLSPEQISFLMRAAVLDERLRTPLRRGPGARGLRPRARRARALERDACSRPEDAGCYRYHGLLAQMLRSSFADRSPSGSRKLHRRAATWHSLHGDVDRAVTPCDRGPRRRPRRRPPLGEPGAVRRPTAATTR